MAIGRPRGAWAIATACGVGFFVLTALVMTHALDHLDVVLRDEFRPHDEWGLLQRRADHVVEGLRPRTMALVLMLTAAGWSVHRRSWWPLVYAASIGLSAAVLTEVTKLLVGRPDPHGATSAHSGSFPSGHTVSVIVCLGGALLIVRSRTVWWQWVIVGSASTAMGLTLLIEGAHWFTDVLGGALLGVAIVAAASQSSLRRRSQEDPSRADRAAHSDLAAQQQTRQL